MCIVPIHVCKHKVCSLLRILSMYGWVHTATSRTAPNQLSFRRDVRASCVAPTDVLRLFNKSITESDPFRSRRTANVRRRAMRKGLRTDITPASLDSNTISTHRKTDSPKLHPVSIPMGLENRDRRHSCFFLASLEPVIVLLINRSADPDCKRNNHFDS